MKEFRQDHPPSRIKAKIAEMGIFPPDKEKALERMRNKGKKKAPKALELVAQADLSTLPARAAAITGHENVMALVAAKRAAQEGAEGEAGRTKSRRVNWPRAYFQGSGRMAELAAEAMLLVHVTKFSSIKMSAGA